MKNVSAVLFLVCLSACASTRIVPIGPDTYFVQREGGSGFSGTNSLRMEAIEEAGKHCVSQGKELVIVSMSEDRGGINLPSADVQFRCLAKGDADLQRPTLEKQPQNVIQIKNK